MKGELGPEGIAYGFDDLSLDFEIDIESKSKSEIEIESKSKRKSAKYCAFGKLRHLCLSS